MLNLQQAIGQKLLVAFEGYDLPRSLTTLLRHSQIGGVTLFRSMNVRNPEQVRSLTAALQGAAAASGQPPPLICADQEGGTLLALAGTTPFPGNMALGATRSPDLARRAGFATGLELAAMGVNVNYAPVCDVNNNPHNPVVGVRSFGEDPEMVARLAAAMVEGMQEAGVAATAKHFPGHGDTATDSHHGMPVMLHDRERLGKIELPPFAAAIQAGTKLIMTAHIALPGLMDGLEIPATLSPPILKGLLRSELGYEGVVVSDAMDMAAITQGPELVVDAIAAVAAGVDLLLLMNIGEGYERVRAALVQAAKRGLLSRREIEASARRVLDLKSWVSRQNQPELSVVGCEDHRALAYEIAAGATTLVRDTTGVLPLSLTPEDRVLAVVPRPADLTPADTSSYESPQLAQALRRRHPLVDEAVVPLDPNPSDVAAIVHRSRSYNLVVVGTINAHEFTSQAALVNTLVDSGVKVITVALRLPYDVSAYPSAPTCICTYSLQPPSMEALADALLGRIPFRGQLPVTVLEFGI